MRKFTFPEAEAMLCRAKAWSKQDNFTDAQRTTYFIEYVCNEVVIKSGYTQFRGQLELGITDEMECIAWFYRYFVTDNQ